MLNLGSHLLVDQMQAESVSGSLHLVDQVADGLDAFHLLSEVLGLKEVAEVAVFSSSRAASMASSGVPIPWWLAWRCPGRQLFRLSWSSIPSASCHGRPC